MPKGLTMNHYRGTVGLSNSKIVSIHGETLKEAMTAAGYIPLNAAKHGNMLSGQLTDGRRFRFKLTPIGAFNAVTRDRKPRS